MRFGLCCDSSRGEGDHTCEIEEREEGVEGCVGWYVVLGCVFMPFLGGNNSNRYCAGGSGVGVMGDRSCEVWFEVCFGPVVPHTGYQDWACDGANVAGVG